MPLAGALAQALPIDVPEHQQEQLRLAALLHDIGHGPFSHVFEPLLARYLGKNHEDFVPWLVNETEIAQRLESADLNPKILGRLAIGKLSDGKHTFLVKVIRCGDLVEHLDYVFRY